MPQSHHESPATPAMLVRQALNLYESILTAYACGIFNGDENRAAMSFRSPASKVDVTVVKAPIIAAPAVIASQPAVPAEDTAKSFTLSAAQSKSTLPDFFEV